MKNKYLIISAVGDNSLHSEWITKKALFDLVLIYYGSNPDISEKYKSQAKLFIHATGQKYHLILDFINRNLEFINKYSYIWMPDDDVSISTESINQMFSIAEKYELELCQPSMVGFISHNITKKRILSFIRFTNFVEVLAPLMSLNCLIKLKDTFNLNESSWGLDILWPLLLKYPKNKIAIIDKIFMRHTKPVGGDYSRFKDHPSEDLRNIIAKHFGGNQPKMSNLKTVYDFDFLNRLKKARIILFNHC